MSDKKVLLLAFLLNLYKKNLLLLIIKYLFEAICKDIFELSCDKLEAL